MIVISKIKKKNEPFAFAAILQSDGKFEYFPKNSVVSKFLIGLTFSVSCFTNFFLKRFALNLNRNISEEEVLLPIICSLWLSTKKLISL